MKIDGKGFIKRRDLYWIIGILICVIILIFSIRLSDNKSVVDIFSFVSSGVSITLAIIAIIYAFYQSLQSQMENVQTMEILRKIDSRIENLMKSKENEFNSSNELKSDLESVENIIDKIKQTNKEDIRTENILNDFKIKINNMKEKQTEYSNKVCKDYSNLQEVLQSKSHYPVIRKGGDEMGKGFSGADRIETLGFEIISLIGHGHKETISKIEEEIKNCNIVKYINNQYKNELFVIFDESCPYNIEDWEKAFFDYTGYVEGNESRKFGVTNEDDGLLLLLALILDIIQFRKSK